ncbi:MAG: S41 family peptidase [Pirellulales bacterium]
MPKRNLILLVLVSLTSLAAYAARERSAAGRRFGEVVSLVEDAYIDPVDAEALGDTAVDAVLDTLDEHSAYVRGAGRVDLEAALDQRFGGVGLELTIDEESRMPIVASPVIDSPAWRAGIRAGDRIEAVEGRTTLGVPLREIVSLLRGRMGERVALRVARPASRDAATLDPAVVPADDAERREVTLVREVIETDSVVGDRRREDGGWDWMLEGEHGIALVRISVFGERTAAELATAVDAIAAGGDLRGFVLDLRGNPGGLLTAAVEVCDLFLDEGVIVHTRRRQPPGGDNAVEPRRATPGARLVGVPMVVLVDGLTASAAEIVAACLQDAGRATIVGSRTFGKGTVQSILTLADDRGLLKLTTGEYLRPSRTSIHRRAEDGDDATWGVTPDAGWEVAPTAESSTRLAAWRRARDAAGPVPGSMVSRALPREIDAVLRRGLEAVSAGAGGPDLRGQEEAPRDDDDPPRPDG